jgi:hypothetical protein
MLLIDKQQYLFKNGEWPIATTSVVKWVGGSPVTIKGGTFNGSQAKATVVGVAANNYDVDKEVGRATFYVKPFIFTLSKGQGESSSYKVCEDPVAPFDPDVTDWAAGDLLTPGTQTVGSDTYAVWNRNTSSTTHSYLMVVSVGTSNSYLEVIAGDFIYGS